ncbi:WbqC family protein [Sulfurimonas crateris]|uniref:WbqC family protein n=1 Tax=Sulfurimonas crateris TaxID=2574727 RepID=A0A4U2Z6G2_9BACT|nr:WbqC family protein [Sulfurimonas crateris]TKI69916.1 WbqC family protein [Sulfurimonas crateris]
MKKVAILQSNYIPWKGYFDLINMVDEFIFYDEVQYTKNDWRNRNKIKTSQGIQWLTIPVRQESLEQKIKDSKITDKKWNIKHWRAISQNYTKTKYFKEYKDIFEELYLGCSEEYLSQINYKFIIAINEILGIDTKLSWSSDYELIGGQTERLINLCKQTDATHYLSGPAAKDYFDEELARTENIQVEWMDYSGYKEYEQLHLPFEHGVCILDLIFNQGDRAKEFMKSFDKS